MTVSPFGSEDFDEPEPAPESEPQHSEPAETDHQPLRALSDLLKSFSPASEATPEASEDCRLYLPDSESWAAHIQRGSERQYCYAKAPGEDFFHLIVTGELFIQKGDEKLCLMCAVRLGVLTHNRLFWQFPGRKKLPKA